MPQTVTSSAGRTYFFLPDSGRGGTFMRINDTASPWLAFLARTFREEFRRSLSRLGWWLRGELRGAVERGGPQGAHWKDLSDAQTFRKIDDLRERPARTKPAESPFLSFVNAIGYKAEKDQLRVRTGWLSPSAARLAAKLQAGFETPITEKMRDMFFAADIGLVKTGSVSTPARPLVRPVYQQVEAEIPQRVERFIKQYLDKSKQQRATA